MGRASVPRLLQARVPASLALLLAVVAAGVLLRPAAASTLQQLGAANLTLLRPLSAGQYAMIEFYASWCPACKHFAPTYQKLAAFVGAQTFDGKEMFVGRIDCAEEGQLCGEFQVPSFPTIYIGKASAFAAKQPKGLTKYEGGHDIESVVKWVSETMKTPLVYDEAAAAAAEAAAEAGAMQQQKQQAAVQHASIDMASAAASKGGHGQDQAPVWDVRDVEGATLQFWKIFATSPTLHSGADKRAALQEILMGWAAAHPSASCRLEAERLTHDYGSAWPAREDKAPQELLSYRICGPSPLFRGWVTCQGSKPDTRGYSCGLWQMLHTMAHRLPDDQLPMIAAKMMMRFLHAFNDHFHQCEPCQKHFAKVLAAPEAAAVKSQRQLVMWLWRVHNEVNVRLQGIEKKYGHSTTGDPAFPKVVFPTRAMCSKCYKPGSGDGGTGGAVEWDEEVVYSFLLSTYGGTSGPERAGQQLRTTSGASSSVTSHALGLPTLALIVGLAVLLCLAHNSTKRRRHASSAAGGAGGGAIK